VSSNTEFRVEGERLIVEVSGTYDIDESVQRFERIVAACRSQQLTQVLIGCRELEGHWSALQEVIYTSQRGAVYQSHLESGGNPLCIAYVVNDALVSGRSTGFDAAQKDGMDIYITTDIDAAMAWLDT